MAGRTIPQRELRNNIAAILREAEAGGEFTITVRGRPVARLGPADETERRRVDVPLGTLRTTLAATPVDAGFVPDIELVRGLEQTVDDVWSNT